MTTLLFTFSYNCVIRTYDPANATYVQKSSVQKKLDSLFGSQLRKRRKCQSERNFIHNYFMIVNKLFVKFESNQII